MGRDEGSDEGTEDGIDDGSDDGEVFWTMHGRMTWPPGLTSLYVGASMNCCSALTMLRQVITRTNILTAILRFLV